MHYIRSTFRGSRIVCCATLIVQHLKKFFINLFALNRNGKRKQKQNAQKKKCATYATYFIIVVPLSFPLSLPLCCKVVRKTSEASRLGARTSIKRKWQRAQGEKGRQRGLQQGGQMRCLPVNRRCCVFVCVCAGVCVCGSALQ